MWLLFVVVMGLYQPATTQAQDTFTFNQTDLVNESSNNPTSLQFGPDDRLYVAQQNGIIKAYTIEMTPNSPANTYTATATENIDIIQDIQNHNDDGTLASNNQRQVTGIYVTGTVAQPVIYVTSSDPRIGAGGGTSPDKDENLDTNSGVISRLTKVGNTWEKMDLVRGLPRSEENHSTNGIQLDGNTLYVMVGGFTNAGAPSNNFAYITEYAYAAALITVDLGAIDALPTKGTAPNEYKYDLPTLDDPTRANVNGIYDPNDPNYDGVDVGDPFGGNDGLNQAKWMANSPVQIFSTGYRNAYDFLIMENGWMYTVDNGPNGGWGGHPLIPDFQNAPLECTNNYDSSEPGSSGPGDGGDGQVNNEDNLHRITQGFYAGHAAPIRGNPSGAGLYTALTHDDGNGNEVVTESFRTTPLDGSTLSGPLAYHELPTDALPVDWPPIDPALPVDPNNCDYRNPGVDDGALETFPSNSTNGLAEYTSTAFEGQMQGQLLAASFKGQIWRIELSDNGNAAEKFILAENFGNTPLDVIAQGDDGPFPGTVWAATYGANNITIFEPTVEPCTPTADLSADDDGDGYTNGDEQDNGTEQCSGASTPPDNDGDLVSDLNDDDDDNDGLIDLNDPYQIDATNGSAITLPVDYPLLNGTPGTGYEGVGFTGWMVNGSTDYLETFDDSTTDGDPSNLLVGGAVGVFTISEVPNGDALGSQNDQQNAFQFGVNTSNITNPFMVEAGIKGAFFNEGTHTPGQSQGMYIGTGDQDNYIKIVLDDGISVVYENNGSVVYSEEDNSLTGHLSAQAIQLHLTVDPIAMTVQPAYSIGTGNLVNVGPPINIAGTGIASAIAGNYAIGGLDMPLAVGLIATNGGASAGPWSADWEYFDVREVPSAATGYVWFGPDGGINASTYGNNSMQIQNTSASGAQITSVELDLSTGIIPDIIFDPDGLAGDTTAKPFSVNSEGGTGYLSHSYPVQHNPSDVSDGYDALLIEFDDFGPGETFSFSVDIDPNSIKGTSAPGPGDSGSVSGLEFAGATVTMTFDNGTIHTAETFRVPDSLSAAENNVNNVAPATPTISVVGQPTLDPFSTYVAEQTITINGPAESNYRLLVLEGGLFEQSGGGHNVSPYDINSIVGVTEYSGSIGLDSATEQTITLTKSGPESGLNYIAAVIEGGDGTTSYLSNVAVIELDPALQPTTLLRINAGGPEVTTGGQTWAADEYFSGGNTYSNSVDIANTTDDVLYQTERWADPVTYDIPVPAAGLYTVDLHFAEIYQGLPGGGSGGGIGSRVFDINIENGQATETGYDIIEQAGGPATAIIETYSNINVTDGALTITLDATSDNAKLSAIEIFAQDSPTAPDTLAYSPASTNFFDTELNTSDSFTLTLTHEGETGGQPINISSIELDPSSPDASMFSLTNNNAPLTLQPGDTTTVDINFTPTSTGLKTIGLIVTHDGDNNPLTVPITGEGSDGTPLTPGEALFRVNAGGPLVGATDGGIDWAEDQADSVTGTANGAATTGTPSQYLNLADGAADVTWGSSADPSSLTNTTGAPNDLFVMERYNASDSATTNMQWDFPIPEAGEYEVRLYFMELWSGANSAGARVFDVEIEGQLELDDYDIYVAAGDAINTATVETFVVNVTDGNLDINFLKVTQNPALKAIEVVPVTTNEPPQVVAIDDQTNTEGDTGISLQVSATDTETLIYSATGLPAGLGIDPTTGLISGDIDAGTAAGSPYAVTVSVTEDSADALSSDVSFTWNVEQPAPPTTAPPYRVNAGGPEIPAIDGGIPWAEDQADPDTGSANGAATTGTPSQYLNLADGAADVTWGSSADPSSLTNTTGAPNDLFVMERYNVSSNTTTNMQWDFPIPEAGEYEVRLYFMELWSGASDPGVRVFDVEIENELALENYDIVVAAGGIEIAVIETYTVNVTDGNLDINFLKVTQNPALKAIEIVALDDSGNAIPQVENPGTQTSELGETITTLAINATDADTDQTLTYTATGLPDGLSIDPATGEIDGTITGVSAPECTTTGGGAFVDDNGLFVIEIESHPPTDLWTIQTDYQDTASGTYYEWDAEGCCLGDYWNSPGTGILEYPILIPEAGRYRFQYRALTPDNFTEHNDVWVQILGDGSAAIGDDNNTNAEINEGNGWFKVYQNENGFNWDWESHTVDNDAHSIYFEFDAPGEYTVRFSGRSSYFNLDRFVVYADNVGTGTATNINNPQSDRLGSVTTCDVTVAATDDGDPQQTGSETFQWIVNEIADNQPPQVTELADQTNTEGDTGISLQVSATDDGATLAYSATGLPASLSIDPATGEISGDIDSGTAANSPYAVTVSVTDDADQTTDVSFTWIINEVNEPPVVTAIADQTNTEGDTGISLQVDATDTETLIYSATGLPASLGIDPATGEISGDIDSGTAAGSPYAVVVTVTEDSADALSSDVSFTWTVTEDGIPPTPDCEPLYRVNAGGPEIVVDGGLNWAAQSTFNPMPGNNYSTGDAVTPAGNAPAALFQTERWDPPAAPNMVYSFDTGDGDFIVNVYLAEIYLDGGITQAGTRIFDIALEGTVPASMDDINLFETYGHDVGVMLTETVTVADGTLDVEFLHGSDDNPAVKGIEVIPVSCAPVLAPIGEQTVDEDASLTVDLSATPVAPDDVLVFTSSTLPGFITLGDNGDGTASLVIEPEIGDAGTYPVTITVTDGNSQSDSETFDVVVNEIDAGVTSAFFQANPGTGVASSTFSNGSFVLTNTSDSGATITGLSINIDDGIFPNMLFDPVGAAGDAAGKCLTPNGGAGATGFINPGDPCVDPFSDEVVTSGYHVMSMNFTDGEFAQGETFTFSVDVDPNSIYNNPDTGDSGAVSGLELIGSTITVTFDDGTTLTGQLYREPGSDGGSQVVLSNAIPTAPLTLSIQGVTTPDSVNSLNQTVDISGPANATVSLLVLDSRLMVDDTPDCGLNVQLFEANEVMDVQEIDVTLDASGNATQPITLNTPIGDPPSGLNFITASVVDTSGPNRANGPVAAPQILAYPDNNQSPLITAIADLAVDEGGTDSFTVNACDVASDEDPALTSAPTLDFVEFIDNGDGTATVNINPLDGDAGIYDITVTATDSGSLTDEDTFTLTVNAVNEAPITQADSYETDEETELNIAVDAGVLANDSDPDAADTLTAALDTTTSNGSLTFNDDGSFDYTPNPDFSGEDTFTYTATDSTVISDPVTVTITVNNVNDVPQVVDDSYATDEDTPLTVAAPGILDNDADADSDTLTPTVQTDVANGTLVLETDGSFTYTPDEHFNGTDSFTYTVNDGTVDSEIATVTLTINPVNDLPIAVDDDYGTNENTPLAVLVDDGVLDNDADADNDTLTPTVQTDVANGTLVLETDGSFTYTPDTGFIGEDSFTYTVNDGTADSAEAATVTLTVNNVNDAPQAVDDSYETDEDTALTVAAPGILDNDSDADNDTLTPTVQTDVANGTLTLNSDGSFTYTPDEHFNGTDNFTYIVNDGTVDSAEATVTITVNAVNDAPLAADDPDYTTDEDTPLTVSIDDSVLDNDSDTEDDSLTAVLASDVSEGTLTLNSDGTFTYTPDADFFGTDAFTYTANDTTDDSEPATVTITVNPVNDLPVAVDDNYGTNENTPLAVIVDDGVLDNDTDADEDSLTASLQTDVSNGSLTLNSDGSFTYTPDTGFVGEDSFTYTVNDGTGDSLEAATVTITVNNVNDVPQVVDDSYNTDEDTPLNVTVVENGVLGNDSDADSDTLTAVLQDTVTSGTLVLEDNGTFTYTPDENFNGTDSFTYQANDGTVNSITATVTINVSAVNDAPDVTDDEYSVDEDNTLTVGAPGVLTNDTDAEADGFTATLGDSPTDGQLTFNDDGSFEYIPDTDFSGEDSFTYTAADENGGEPNTATVTITVNPINDIPVANNDEYTFAIGESTEVNAENGVLANDTDADNDPLDARISSQGTEGGTISMNEDGSFEYTAPAAFENLDDGQQETETFEYIADDDQADSEVATITIIIDGANIAPVANDDSESTTDEDTAIDISVLDNDEDANEEDEISVASVDATSANGAALTINADGTITYDPMDSDTLQAMGDGANISDTFTYTITDGDAEDSATVTVGVTGINDPAQANDDSNSTDNDVVLTVDAPGVLANDEDPEGESITVTGFDATSTSGATVTVAPDGAYTYDPTEAADLQALANDQIVDDTFTYTITGGATATVTITVRGGDAVEAPTAEDDSVSGVSAGDVLSINVLENDTYQGDATIDGVSGVSIGIAVPQPDGTIQYTAPDTIPADTSSTTFTYTLIDETGLSSEATVTVTFNVAGPSLNMVVSPTYQEVPEDLDAEFNITFINNGDEDLTNITTNFMDHFTSCTPDMSASFDLATGETLEATCMIEGVTENLTFTLEAQADNTVGVSAPIAQFRTIGLDNAPAQQQTTVQAQVQVEIVVTENQPPVANNDNATVTSGVASDIDVLSNDSDPENRIDNNSVQITTQPVNGTAVVNNGVVNYVSNDGYVGNDAFNYEMCDESDNCATAGVTIDISDAPVDNTGDNNDDDDNDDNNDGSDDSNDASVAPANTASGTPNAAINALGLTNDENNHEWFVTVTNTGNGPLQNAVVTHTVGANDNILNATSDAGQLVINGQVVTINIPLLQPGQQARIVVTTPITGARMSATSCISADGNIQQCADGLAVAVLPSTGETPWWRNWVLALSAGLLSLGVAVPVTRRYRNRS